MNITVIYGQNHKGNTWAFTRLFLERLRDDDTRLSEFYLPEYSVEVQAGAASGKHGSPPEKMLGFCRGCFNCITKGEKYCPQADFMQPIITALDNADLIIVSSPCYVMNMTGQLKTFFDHMAYRFMIHRPEPSVFRKQALALSTAAGAGMEKTVKAIYDNLFFWGIPRIYRYGLRMAARDFEHLPEKRRQKIIRKVNRITNKIKKNNGRVRPGLKTRLIFLFSRLGQKKNDWSSSEKEYWITHGWLENKKPF